MAKIKRAYVCQNCGNDSPKWIGKCPACGEWNTYVEEIIGKETKQQVQMAGIQFTKEKPVLISDVETTKEIRIDTHSTELNRVLGGGLVPGSLVLIGGEPGIGKSTLALQVVLNIHNKKVLYVSGEESVKKIKLRAERLSSNTSDTNVIGETT